MRVSRVKRNAELAQAVQQQMLEVAGVRSIEANPLTGSVVIHYDPAATSAGAIISTLTERGYAPEQSRPEPVRAVVPGATRRSRSVAQKAANAVAWYVLETALERSLPLLITALL